MVDNLAPVLTIDGPSGSGKGTVSAQLASLLRWHLLDSGALYRLVALAVLQQGLELEQTEALGRLAEQLEVSFHPNRDGQTDIRLAGEPVGQVLRGSKTSAMASKVAAIPEVRSGLVALQQAFQQAPGLVADGRDMGTVIFPQADLKIFLTASPEERAQRRYKQLKEKGENVNLARLFEDIKTRDERDRNRAVAPLRPAADAVLIDSTGMSIAEVVAEVLALLTEHGFYPS